MTIAPPDTIDDELTLTLIVERARRRLTEAPELVEYVRIRRQPGAAVRDGQPGAPSRTPHAPLHVGALDDADAIYVDLVGHVRQWARELSVSTLKVALRSGEWTTDGVLLAFRSTTTPPGAARLVRDLSDWLLLHLDRIATHAGGPEFLHDVAVSIEAVYCRFPLEARPDRTHSRRPCGGVRRARRHRGLEARRRDPRRHRLVRVVLTRARLHDERRLRAHPDHGRSDRRPEGGRPEVHPHRPADHRRHHRAPPGRATRMTLAKIRALLKQHGHKTNVEIDRIDVKRAYGVVTGVDVMLVDGTVTFLPVEEGTAG
ncbi:hypothetical protein [Curtobacterium flaccumfaciens]|uniref:hypothetical protein n=1 Tax=Curtobacterium flaccumfaciens TaxID=2035 RepID=UPI00265ADFF6|nr:hypothetical protein [Curtobacterium flaccumfaciens]MCS5507131.1 hypothetical protein [Curtobacterium flaccumfaciens pv. flaccumfaciens]